MTTKPPPGIYRIVVAGNSEPALLTRLGEERVTILAPGTEPDPQQEVCCLLTTSIVFRLPAILVANRPG